MNYILNDSDNFLFDEIISIIDNARIRALRSVNTDLIQMYRNVGEYLSALCANSGFGNKVIDETSKDDEFVAPLMTQISWTNHLLIMSGSKSAEESIEDQLRDYSDYAQRI